MWQEPLIDSVTFAQQREQAHGTLAISALERLADLVLERTGEAHYSLTGGVDSSARPIIDVEVRARLVLACQRCLDRLDYMLERKTRLLIVKEGMALPELSEEEPDIEAVPASSVGDIADLVEQEILLGLPLAPTHAEGVCTAEPEARGTRASSPFAVLAGLKGS